MEEEEEQPLDEGEGMEEFEAAEDAFQNGSLAATQVDGSCDVLQTSYRPASPDGRLPGLRPSNQMWGGSSLTGAFATVTPSARASFEQSRSTVAPEFHSCVRSPPKSCAAAVCSTPSVVMHRTKPGTAVAEAWTSRSAGVGDAADARASTSAGIGNVADTVALRTAGVSRAKTGAEPHCAGLSPAVADGESFRTSFSGGWLGLVALCEDACLASTQVDGSFEDELTPPYEGREAEGNGAQSEDRSPPRGTFGPLL